MIGNSVVAQSKPQIEGLLSDDFDVTVLGQGGYTIDQSFGTARRFGHEGYDVIVIELGTNDALRGDDDLAADLDELLSYLTTVSCVVIVTNNTLAVDLDYVARSVEYNEYIRSGPWRVADWDAFAYEYRDGGDPWGHLTTDTIHPTELGRYLLAAVIEEQVEACEPPAPSLEP